MHTNEHTQSMDKTLSDFLIRRRIDSFHKVWFLLFLWQRSEHSVNRFFARALTFSDEPTLDEIIDELSNAGLLRMQDDECILRQGAEINAGLASMQATFEDPIARQHLLNCLYQQPPVHYS